MQKTVESIQADLDNELTLRQQAVRAKSKLEADLADIEVQLGHANHQAEQAIRKGLEMIIITQSTVTNERLLLNLTG